MFVSVRKLTPGDRHHVSPSGPGGTVEAQGVNTARVTRDGPPCLVCSDTHGAHKSPSPTSTVKVNIEDHVLKFQNLHNTN